MVDIYPSADKLADNDFHNLSEVLSSLLSHLSCSMYLARTARLSVMRADSKSDNDCIRLSDILEDMYKVYCDVEEYYEKSDLTEAPAIYSDPVGI